MTDLPDVYSLNLAVSDEAFSDFMSQLREREWPKGTSSFIQACVEVEISNHRAKRGVRGFYFDPPELDELPTASPDTELPFDSVELVDPKLIKEGFSLLPINFDASALEMIEELAKERGTSVVTYLLGCIAVEKWNYDNRIRTIIGVDEDGKIFGLMLLHAGLIVEDDQQ